MCHTLVASCRSAAAHPGQGSLTCCRYAAPLYVDIKKIVRTKLPEDEGGDWAEDVEEYPKVFIGEASDPCSAMRQADRLPHVCDGPCGGSDKPHARLAGAHHAAVELLQPGGEIRQGAGGSGGVPL